VTTVYLVNQKPGHNKFYIIHTDQQWNVHTRWGRLGKKMTVNPPQPGYTERGSKNIASEILYKKERKGYKVIDEKIFKMLETQALIMGTNTKILMDMFDAYIRAY